MAEHSHAWEPMDESATTPSPADGTWLPYPKDIAWTHRCRVCGVRGAKVQAGTPGLSVVVAENDLALRGKLGL